MSPKKRPVGPWSSFRFRVEIEGIPFTGFCRVDGLESSSDIVQPDDARKNKPSQRLGHQRVRNITLQRAASAQRHLWDWHHAAINGKKDRRNGVIHVLGDDGEVALSIHFKQAWPCRWRLTTLDALNSDVLIEEVELSVKKLDVR